MTAPTLHHRTIRLHGVDDRFSETGYVVVDAKDVPEVVMLNGDCFIAMDGNAAGSAGPLHYRKVRPYRFVRRVMP
jgi:hypothetical protein